MEKKIMLIIGAFIAIIIGVLFTVIIADNVATNTKTTSVVNETVAVSNSSAKQVAYYTYGLASVDKVYNASSTLITSGNYTTDLTYGTIKSNNADVGNWKVSYTYLTSTYIADTTTRTIEGLLALFFVLGVIGVVLFYMYRQLEDTGLI